MAWDHIGKPISTADAASAIPTMYQTFRVTTGYKNQVLLGCVAGLLFYNNPVFTDVRLEVWSDRGGLPKRKMYESDFFLQADCNTDIFAYRIMGFTFPRSLIKKNTLYHLAVRPSGYTGDAASHIAWRQSWPDPQYRVGVTISLEFGIKYPYETNYITADQ